MSKYVSYQPVEGVFNHPNADRLSIVRVGRRETVHPTEEARLLRPGDKVVRFPVGICIDPVRAKELRIDNYCKTAQYRGSRSRSRIITTKIRGVHSSGFIVPSCTVPDDQLDEFYGVEKYIPPRAPVKISVTKKGPDWVYQTRGHPYLLDKNLMGLLNHLCDGTKPVTVFGKLAIGEPIKSVGKAYLVVDMIMVDYKWVDWDLITHLCELYNIETFVSVRPGA